MKKLLKCFLISAIAPGAVFFVSACGGVKTDQPAAEQPEVTVESFDAPLKITVSKNGFEPKTIGVKKGQTVKLAFIRTDEENCGDEIVFAKQNIRKKLPLYETVPVELTAAETGEITFACGMDMLRGKIIVQ